MHKMDDFCRRCQEWLAWFPLFPHNFVCGKPNDRGGTCPAEGLKRPEEPK